MRRELNPASGRQVQGTQTELIIIRCTAGCGRFVAIRVFSADLRRHNEGAFVQDCFPYLSPELREMLISGTCPECWAALCPGDPFLYH